jgi:hypothetical protein
MWTSRASRLKAGVEQNEIYSVVKIKMVSLPPKMRITFAAPLTQFEGPTKPSGGLFAPGETLYGGFAAVFELIFTSF